MGQYLSCVRKAEGESEPKAAEGPALKAAPNESPEENHIGVDPYADKAEARKARRAYLKFQNLTGETAVREPGDLHGDNFNVRNCTDCDIFLFDHTSQVLIDNCTNCRFFLGPIDGSLFFRNCTDCKFVAICRQLRTRDSKNIDLMLLSSTKPTIETTTNIRFSCFQFSYFNLAAHFEAANMSVWDNRWTDVYDFNEATGLHHKLVTGQEATNLINVDHLESILKSMKVAEFEGSSIVPLTSGRTETREGRSFVMASTEEDAKSFLVKMQSEGSSCLGDMVRTATLKFSAAQVKSFFDASNPGHKAAAAAAFGGKVVGIEFVESPALADAVASQKGIWVSDNPYHHIDQFFLQMRPSDQ